MKDWKQQFREEFGIHFKNSPDELEFALEFISEELKKEYRRGLLNDKKKINRIFTYLLAIWLLGLTFYILGVREATISFVEEFLEEKERYTQALQDIEQNHPRAYCQFFTDEKAEYWSFESPSGLLP